MNKKYTVGFTLIELMITVAILGILSAIAVPSYVEYVSKGKRTDAKIELLRISQLQESFFAENLSYAKDFSSTRANGGLGLGAIVKSEQEEYVVTMTAAGANGGCGGTSASSCASYTLTAAPKTGGAQVNDKCGSFTLTNTGLRGSTGTGETTQRCWK